MPRVHYVLCARKKNPVCDRGESYFWWKFPYSSKQYSLTRPYPSQLTQSAFLAGAWGVTERVERPDPSEAKDWKDQLEGLIEDAKSTYSELHDDCVDNLEAMPEALQASSSGGGLLQERIDALDEKEDALDRVLEEVQGFDNRDFEDKEDKESEAANLVDEVLEAMEYDGS